MRNCVTIGVTGGSGSGKTCLVRDLCQMFDAEKISVLSQDDYYRERDLQEKDAQGYENFDQPNSLNLATFARDLSSLKDGKQVKVREYLYNKSKNEHDGHIRILEPAPILLVEGLFIHGETSIREQLDYLIFVEVAGHLRLLRRIKRDQAERNYSLQNIMHRYQHHVIPSYLQHVEPARDLADVVINNNHSYQRGLEVLQGFVQNVLRGN